jgi:polyhydroxybutyrate depolymerase
MAAAVGVGGGHVVAEPSRAPIASTPPTTPARSTAGAAQVIEVPAGPQPESVAGVRWTSGIMRVGRYERSWWLATPEHPVAAKIPLLMVLHGRSATPAAEARRTGFLGEVAAGEALAAYPAGYHASWNAGRCCGVAHTAGIDDLTFLSRLADQLRQRPDVSEFDLVGFSNGAKMSFDLVCSGALRPHAIAVAEAVPTTDCDHAPAVPLIQIAGTADPLVPYANVDPKLVADGVPLVPVLTEVSSWAGRAGCTPAPAITEPQRQLQVWSGCDAPVELITYPGGAHVWQPDATPVIWQFITAGPDQSVDAASAVPTEPA